MVGPSRWPLASDTSFRRWWSFMRVPEIRGAWSDGSFRESQIHIHSRSRGEQKADGVATLWWGVERSAGALKYTSPARSSTNWHRSYCQRKSGQRPAAQCLATESCDHAPLKHTSDDHLHAGCPDSTLLVATAGCLAVAVALRPRRVATISHSDPAPGPSAGAIALLSFMEATSSRASGAAAPSRCRP